MRAGQVQLTDGYVVIRDGELYLIGCRINALRSASTHVNPEADRTKKLLMHKEEIRRLIGKVEQKGFTLVPLNLHCKGGSVKAEIALAKGKAEHDKRDTEKKRDWEREKGRLMRHKVSSKPEALTAPSTRTDRFGRSASDRDGLRRARGLGRSNSASAASACSQSAIRSSTASRPTEKRTSVPGQAAALRIAREVVRHDQADRAAPGIADPETASARRRRRRPAPARSARRTRPRTGPPPALHSARPVRMARASPGTPDAAPARSRAAAATTARARAPPRSCAA